jgi:hypothetical protein
MTTKYDSLENSIFSNQFLALIFYLFLLRIFINVGQSRRYFTKKNPKMLYSFMRGIAKSPATLCLITKKNSFGYYTYISIIS